MKAIVLLHDATIDIRSDGVGAGTTLVMRWPCSPAPHRASSQPRVLTDSSEPLPEA